MSATHDRQFHTLVVGGAAKNELLLRLEAAGVRLNALAFSLFEDERFTTAPTPATVQLKQVSVASLGFAAGATFSSVVQRAAEAGLELCALELAPYFRLSLPQQLEVAEAPGKSGCAPPGSITVASAPLDDRDETPKGFYLRRIEGTLWLRGYRSSSDHIWSPNDVLAFVARRGA